MTPTAPRRDEDGKDWRCGDCGASGAELYWCKGRCAMKLCDSCIANHLLGRVKGQGCFGG